MKTIHVINTEDERKLVKDIFRKAIADKSNGLSELNFVDNVMDFRIDEDTSCLFGEGYAVVYDFHDPDFKDEIVAYDFNELKIHLADDTAGCFDFPSHVWPF